MTDHPGTLYLIPTPLGKRSINTVIPDHVLRIVHELRHFAVENLPQATSFLQWAGHPVEDFRLSFYPLHKKTGDLELQEYITLMLNGNNLGILTDAGCPGVADPGAGLVQKAHHFGIKVVPLTGPSSPLLALMASGLGGQRFAFSGYLSVKPSVREKELQLLEKRSAENESTELFMEAPHRNINTFKSAMKALGNETFFSIAAAITLENEAIHTKRIADWKHSGAPAIDKIPAIFALKAPERPKPDLSRKAVKKKFSA